MLSGCPRALLLAQFLLPVVCGAQSSGCYASTTDSVAVRLLSFARFSVGSTDSTQVAGRASIGIPTVDSSKVVLTTDARTCASLVTALNTYLNTRGATRRVQIAKLVNAGYLAYDGFDVIWPRSGSNPVYLFSKQFVVKAVLLGL